tara:strand:+ start:673 stop:1383 length:711 start_codon:yes stop_codon:yes gene_type:complete
MEGWISLHRKFLTWEWYDDTNTKCLFIHLLLSANHKEKNWRGITIKRGQLFTSIKSLSLALGMTEKKIRNSLKKLQKTQDLVIQGANNGTMVTLCNYATYQDVDKTKGEQKGKRGANEGRTKGKQRATNNNVNNDNNVKNDNKLLIGLRLFKNDELYIFDNFKENFIGSKYENADLEYYHEAVKNWADSSGAKKRDWAATARNFMLRDFKDGKLKTNKKILTDEQYEYQQWLNAQN